MATLETPEIKTITNDEGTFKVRAGGNMDKAATSYLSSEDGMNTIQDTKSSISNLSKGMTVEEYQAAIAAKSKPTTPPDTKAGGGLSLEDVLTVTKDLTGWKLNADGTYTPGKDALGGLGVSKTDTQADEADATLAKAKAERDSLYLKLQNLDVSSDPALQQQVSGITGAWDARIAEMDRINRSRVAAIRTTGVRLGSRYTGGDGGVMGSIVTAEEREGVDRIAKLQGDKQQAILEAQNAYENKQWTRYYQLGQLADKKYQEMLNEVEKLNKVQAEQDKKLREEVEEITKNDSIYNAVVKLGSKADPMSLYQELRNSGTTIGMDDIDKFWKAVGKDSKNGLLKFSQTQLGKMFQRGYTSDQIQAIQDDFNDGGPETVIAGLPKSEQNWIRSILVYTPVGGGGVGGALTWSELAARGLPPELFGKSEEQVMGDIVRGGEAPNWFKQYLGGTGAGVFAKKFEAGGKYETFGKFDRKQFEDFMLEPVVQEEWNNYRGTITKNLLSKTETDDGSAKSKVIAAVKNYRSRIGEEDDEGEEITEELIRSKIEAEGYNPDDPAFQ